MKTFTVFVSVINFQARPEMVGAETENAGIAKFQDLFLQGDGGASADNPYHLDFCSMLYLYSG